MKERERLVVSGLVALLLLPWLGFLFHASPRFAGSLAGGVLGVAGALLMLVPLAYLIVKRISPLKKLVTRRVSMRTLLAWHIYAGILGPILALLHTGHKFVSPLGIALTALTLVVVVSGFVGRYLLNQFSQEVREKKEMLTRLELAYRETAGGLADAIADLEYAIKTHETFKRWFAGWLRLHIVLSLLLYVLLALHVWAGIHFGLRWF